MVEHLVKHNGDKCDSGFEWQYKYKYKYNGMVDKVVKDIQDQVHPEIPLFYKHCILFVGSGSGARKVSVALRNILASNFLMQFSRS